MEVTLTDPQSQILTSPARFKVIAAGRRFGKTWLCLYTMLYEASVPRSKVFYVTTSYRAAKQILWQELKDALWGSNWIDRINEADLSITLKNRSVITLRGSDNPDSLRGVGLNCVVLDECAYMEQRVWSEVIRPALSDTGGSAMFISSPAGRNFFYELYQKGVDGEPGWESWQFTTLQGGNVPAEEIEYARKELDAKTFEQEYEAQFTNYHGIVYYNYHPEESVLDMEYKKGRTLLIGMDFNIDPMSAIVMQKSEDKLNVIDEIIIYSSNTDEMCDEIKFRYPKESIIVYPDPAASQRRTSAGGKTDIHILQNAGFRVRHRNSHPFVRDRINSVNSRLLSGDNKRHLFINTKCRHLRESLARQTYKEGTAIPDKSSGYDHACFVADQKVLTDTGLHFFKDLPPSGKIKTYNDSWVRYIHGGKTGRSAVTIRFRLQSGSWIECTPEHRILTIHGFEAAQELRFGEMLAKPNPNYKPPKPSEREVREDIDDLFDDFSIGTKKAQVFDRIMDIEYRYSEKDVYCLYVSRWHCFQLANGVTVSNCDALGYAVEYLFPVKRSGSPIKGVKLGGL